MLKTRRRVRASGIEGTIIKKKCFIGRANLLAARIICGLISSAISNVLELRNALPMATAAAASNCCAPEECAIVSKAANCVRLKSERNKFKLNPSLPALPNCSTNLIRSSQK